MLGLKVLGFGGCVTNSREASGKHTERDMEMGSYGAMYGASNG